MACIILHEKPPVFGLDLGCFLILAQDVSTLTLMLFSFLSWCIFHLILGMSRAPALGCKILPLSWSFSNYQ